MRKKILCLSLVALASLASLSALPLFQLGVSAQIPFGFSSDEEFDFVEPFTEFENYRFGAEARVNLSFFQVGVSGVYSFDFDEMAHYFDGAASLGFTILPKSPVSATLGFGIPLSFVHDDGSFHVLGADGGDKLPMDSFGDVVLNSPFLYRLTLNFDFLVHFAVTYSVPTSATMTEAWPIELWAPNWEQGRLTLTFMLLNLF